MPPTGIHCPAVDLDVDPLEQLGLVLVDPRVLLGLRAGEAVLGQLVHQPHRRGERPHALAHRLAHRPQPRRVDVGVAGGDDAVARPGPAGAASAGASTARRRRRRTRRCAERRRARAPRPPQIRGRRGSSSASARISPSSTSMSCSSASASVSTTTSSARVEPVQRALAGGLGRARSATAGTAGRRVRCRLDDQRDGARARRRPGPPAARVDALHRPAALVDDQPLALEPRRVGAEPEIDDRLDPPARPRRRDGRR